VQVFRTDGTFVRGFGSKGMAAGQFDSPHAVVRLEPNRLAVVDHANNRIQIVDGTGGVRAVAMGPRGDRPLRRPTSAALSMEGLLFVVDKGNHRVVGWKLPQLSGAAAGAAR
jgi:hypothetical protein